jgi:peptidase M23-like protein
MLKQSLGLALSISLCLYSPAAPAGGLIGDALGWVGDRTGVKPIKKLGTELDNASRDIKKTVPVYKEIEEGGSRIVRETFKWIENHPEEALIIAGVIVTGWAACVDGCALVAKIVVDGKTLGAVSGGTVSIPIVVLDPFKKRDRDEPPSDSPHRQVPTQAPVPAAAEAKDPQNPEKIYPRYYSKVEYPSPNGLKDYIPKISFKSLDEKFLDVLLTFSLPAADAKPREPTASDPAGGIFTSPRNPIGRDAEALYGKGTRGRLHGATDWLMAPGTPVLATMTGVVERIGRTGTGFPLVEIKAFDGTTARQLYVELLPSIKKGVSVTAGETLIGHASNLAEAKEYVSVPNHVHIDYADRKGRRFDPFLNVYIENAPLATEAKAAGRK